MAKTIIIIGGGAAGMMAAAMAKEQYPECGVALFEKNPYLGAKVIISGGGRCNVTTGVFDVKELLKNYPRGAKFLMTAMFRFPPEKVMQWFEEHDVPLKTEEDLRVFPKSDNGKDIVGALEKDLRWKGVEIFCNAQVTNVIKQGEKFTVVIRRAHSASAEACGFATAERSKKNGSTFTSDTLIITTGGNAYRHTGSTGDGYAFAAKLGHTITPLGPSLNSFLVDAPEGRDGAGLGLAGVSFEHAKLTLNAGEKTYERLGPFVFTHRGVSGPAVFALSSYSAYEEISPAKPLRLMVDFFPDEKSDTFERRLFDLVQKNPQKTLTNFLDILLPKSLCGVVASLSAIMPDVKAGSLTKQNRSVLAHLLKEFPLTVIGRSAGEEFVTAGGVDTSEVNTNTMKSKICPGLYFAGEILDVDGFTGGFNLQASWATGALAGSSAAR